MSRGFTGTTQKQRRSPHNGNIHHPRGQRKHGRSAATSRFCWPFFSTTVGWCIMNMHHKAKPSLKSTMRVYSVAFAMLYGANDRTCGQQKLGSSITTMHPPILRIWFKVFLAKHKIPLIRQAPYSPDMAPCDFWLFPKLKMPLKGTQFESREDIMRNATAQLYMIPQEAFQKCFQQWQDRWKKCVHYQGDYYEGD